MSGHPQGGVSYRICRESFVVAGVGGALTTPRTSWATVALRYLPGIHNGASVNQEPRSNVNEEPVPRHEAPIVICPRGG